jgi:hypothetical protein
VCYCGSALTICPWRRAKYRSACLMLKSTSPAAARVGVAPCCWGGCAWDEDSRASFSLCCDGLAGDEGLYPS